MAQLFGRQNEIKEFDTILHADEATFLAMYGRRRVGKTFLINQYFHNKGIYLELTGIKKASLKQQLHNFVIAFSDLFCQGKAIDRPQNWFDAFTLLRKQVEKIPKQEKIILFFDELPWLATPRSEFLPALEHCWNRYLSRMQNIILIVCGSAASWMIDNIIYNKGGLYGRISKEIRLLPFTLIEAEQFLQSRHVTLSRKDLLEIYMTMGGVAQYLIQVKPGKSAAQVINDVCFTKNGYLFKEFEKMYSSLFDDHETHIQIIRQLAKHKNGLDRNTLLEKVGLISGGTSSKILKELEEAGMIVKIPVFGSTYSKWAYHLSDEYSLFYLDWIESAPDTSLQGIEPDYWIKQQTNRRWSTWSGYAFENICLKHVDKIKKALGISGISTTALQWSYTSPPNTEQEGAQIDLVIDRADNCINLCEIKFCNTEFVVDKEYAERLNREKAIFQCQTKTTKTLFTTLITSFGTKENQYYLSAVQNQLSIDNLFDARQI